MNRNKIERNQTENNVINYINRNALVDLGSDDAFRAEFDGLLNREERLEYLVSMARYFDLDTDLADMAEDF